MSQVFLYAKGVGNFNWPFQTLPFGIFLSLGGGGGGGMLLAIESKYHFLTHSWRVKVYLLLRCSIKNQ